MNTAIINHIKGQLKVLRDSDSLDYSKGIIDSLLAFIDVSCPKEITLSIGQGNINLIQAIKEVRALTGLGLAESKQLVEMRSTFYKTTNVSEAINVKKQFEAKGISIDIKGDGAIGLLFAKD